MLMHVDKGEVMMVTKSERISYHSFSKGNQLKWFHDGKFIKLNNGDCYEDISEILVSYLLKFTSIKNYVEYYPCEIVEDGIMLGYGCYSYNFLNAGESDITFVKLFKRKGIDIYHASYDDVRDGLLEVTGIDFKPYIDACLCIDAITFNEDRHFNNLSVIYSNGRYRHAPVYDNGMSCLSDVYVYPLSENINTNLKKCSQSRLNLALRNS